MVTTLSVNTPNNDIFVGPDGNLSLSTGILAVEYACKAVSLAQLGEMIYATTQGLPTFETVWNGVPNLALYINALRAAILGVPGVVSITSLTTSVANNTLTYTATIETQFGNLYLEG